MAYIESNIAFIPHLLQYYAERSEIPQTDLRNLASVCYNVAMDNDRHDPCAGLCELMRSLSKGMIMETSHVFQDVMDVYLKDGSHDDVLRDLILEFIRMLGQVARQMNAVVLPDLINVYTDFSCLGDYGQAETEEDVRQCLDRVDRAAKRLRTETLFRLPDEPALNYPPPPEFLPDERAPSFDRLIEDIAEQTRLLERYANAFHADRPLGKGESSSLDAGALANFLESRLEREQSDGCPGIGLEDADKAFDQAVEGLDALKSTVRTLLDEAAAYAKRHRSIHLSTCCDLQLSYEDGQVGHDFAKRFKQMLDDLWLEAMTRDKRSGNGAGRKKAPARTEQVEKGAEKKRATPSRSSLSIARDILMHWAGTHGEESAKQGYQNDEKGIKVLSEAIDRLIRKQARADGSRRPSEATAEL